MKKTSLKIATTMAMFQIPTIVCLLIGGCATPVIVSPGHPATTNVDGTITPAVSGVTNYVPNKTVTQVVSYGGQVAPFVPDPWGGLLQLGLGTTTAIAAWFAAKKNAEAAKQRAAADSLAESVVRSGATNVTTALQTAGANGVIETVAKHIDNNTPA